MAMGALICFNCCITEQPAPKRRRRIDRSMIGEPMNFRHTAHVGSGDVTSNSSNSSIDRSMIGELMNFRHTAHMGSGDVTSDSSNSRVNNIQDQMSSKGDVADTTSPVAIHLNVIDLPSRHNS